VRPQPKCEEDEKRAEEDALKTILEENECRRKRTFIPAENTQFRVGGLIRGLILVGIGHEDGSAVNEFDVTPAPAPCISLGLAKPH
jgi:hypothetical protein